MQAVQIPATAKIISKALAVVIDSELLFQRLVTVCSDEDMKSAFQFELAHYPPSLFTDDGIMRDPKKSELGKHLTDTYTFDDVVPNINNGKWRKVVDGGMLLHKIPWEIGSTFSCILDSYVKYVNGYGDNVDIIFDGYSNSNTRGHCHRRRNPIQSTNIEFTANMKLDCRKDLFLSNTSNKEHFVNLLTVWLISAGHNATQHTDDADRVIVKKAVNLLTENNVCVYADDTDFLVLLVSSLNSSFNHTIYLKQEKANKMINLTSLVQCIPFQSRNIYYCHMQCQVVTPLDYSVQGRHGYLKVAYWKMIQKIARYSTMSEVLPRILSKQVKGLFFNFTEKIILNVWMS